jgi:hypothetical protein
MVPPARSTRQAARATIPQPPAEAAGNEVPLRVREVFRDMTQLYHARLKATEVKVPWMAAHSSVGGGISYYFGVRISAVFYRQLVAVYL